MDSSGRILVPSDKELRTFIIAENHDTPLGGHFGAERTLELVQRHWTWTGIARDIREYVRSCRECQLQKHMNAAPAGLLHPIVARRPWQLVTLDLVGGLPPSGKERNTQIMVMVDKFSKYVCLEPCTAEIDAKQAAEIFQKRVIAEHGVPQAVISDRGPQFASQVWKYILTTMGSKVALAATHHPQSDGQSERNIQTLARLVRTYAHKDPEHWSTHLPFIQFAMNNAPSNATQYSPFEVLHGRSPTTPLDLWKGPAAAQPPSGNPQSDTQLVANWARTWWKARKALRSFVYRNLRDAADAMKERHDRRRKPLLLEPGDLVLLSAKSHSAFEGRRKLGPCYFGPYVVEAKVHENAYKLNGLPPEVPPTQNVQFLRRFYPTPRKFMSRPEAEYARPIQVDTHVEWEVEAITDHRILPTGTQYKIKWVGEQLQSWLRAKHLRNCQRMLREYQAQHQIPLSFWSDSESSGESSEEENPPSGNNTTPGPRPTDTP